MQASPHPLPGRFPFLCPRFALTCWFGVCGLAGWFFLLKCSHQSGVKEPMVVKHHDPWNWYYMAMERKIRKLRLGDQSKISAVQGFWLTSKVSIHRLSKGEQTCTLASTSTTLWGGNGTGRLTEKRVSPGRRWGQLQKSYQLPDITKAPQRVTTNRSPTQLTLPPAGYKQSMLLSHLATGKWGFSPLAFLPVTIKILKSLTSSYFPWAVVFKGVYFFFSYPSLL